jgi:hypothetical protein
MRRLFTVFATLLAVLLPYSAFSQVNTLYFMENVPMRNALNPAFIPTQMCYVSLPGLSDFSYIAGNNSFATNDLFFRQNGKVITPFHPDANRDAFLNVLKPTTDLISNTRTQLFGFGFSIRDNYYSFGINERIEGGMGIPRDLMRLLLKGAPDSTNVNSFNLRTLHSDITAYLETTLGYARPVNKKLTLGGKIKFLLGQGHADASFSKLDMNISKQTAELTGSGAARITTPFDIPQNSDGTPDFGNIDTDLKTVLKPSGWGLGADLGAVYKLKKNITLSASLTDIGFINWKKSSWRGDLKSKTTFSGMDFTINGNGNDNDFGKQIGDSLKNAFVYTANGAAYTTWLTAKMRVGGEYSILKNKIDFGLLWENTIGGSYKYNELTASANFRPAYWFNASLSYGLVNGNYGSFGLGLNLIAGPVNFFVVTDYMPAYYTSDGIPYKSKYADAQMGLILTFGHNKKFTVKKKKNAEDQKNKQPETK